MKKLIIAAIVIASSLTTVKVISKTSETAKVPAQPQIDKTELMTKGFGTPKSDIANAD